MTVIGINIDSTEELGDNKNNARLKSQTEKTEVLEGHGLNIKGRK